MIATITIAIFYSKKEKNSRQEIIPLNRLSQKKAHYLPASLGIKENSKVLELNSFSFENLIPECIQVKNITYRRPLDSL